MPGPPNGKSRDVPEPPRGPRLRARDAIVAVAIAVLLLVLFEGPSLRDSGEEMQPGWERSVVLAVGKPAGWLGEQLPLHEVDLFAWLSSDDDVGRGGGFERQDRAPAGGGRLPPVGPESFDPVELGANSSRPRPLRKVLVTGDSLAMPLDLEMARRLAEAGEVRVERDPHVGTGVSKSGFVDWGKLSRQQVDRRDPDAVVVFIGANEGFPMPGPRGRELDCCGPEWAAEYANRARRMMDTYRQRGAARVYWLTLPLPRDRERQEIARAVNAALEVASVPYRQHVRVLDMERVFTPDGRYRDAMAVNGRRRIVREGDGIHLNGAGAGVAAEVVLATIRRDFRVGAGGG